MTINNLKMNMWTDIITIINTFPGENITAIQKKSNCTYAHILDIIKLLKDNKLILTEQHGRTTTITVTPSGKVVADNIISIRDIVGGE